MIGSSIDQFRVVEKIGAGGMGEVYLAQDEALDRQVVLKLLPPGALSDETARARFRSEALALSRLNHPNVCIIYQVGEAESGEAAGQTYIAMEYVEGESLDELIKEGRLPRDSIARYGAQIAAALEHAHTKGLTHRDMKAANVIITPDGRVKVLDFGLAVTSAAEDRERAQLTQTGTIVGTPAYLAPEIIRGERADPRSDLWSLGVVLYEMVAGKRPFAQTGHALIYAILEETPEVPEWAPPPLGAIISRCLAKSPGERFQTSAELRAALEALDGHGASVSSGAGVRRERRRAGPKAVLAGSVAALLALAFGLGMVPRWFAGPVEAATIGSIAVLPFTSFSGSEEQEYFVDGMTDALIGELAKMGTLNVIARTSVMAYKESELSIQEIAQELDVDGILEGSAVSSGGRIRLAARLIDPGSNSTLWSDEYERDMSDVLALQSEMARTIGGRIEAALTPDVEARLVEAGPVDPEAYELTLQGRYYANQLTEEGLRTAINLFEQAIARDPRYVPAYAGKAFAHANLSSAYVAPLVQMPEAKAAATRAIELDSTVAEAHTWLGYAHVFFDWDWEAGERELITALELNPSSGEAHLAYAGYLVGQARFDEAIEHAERAKEIDPLSIFPYSSPNGSQWTLFIARRFEESVAEGRAAVALDPSNAWAHTLLGTALVHAGAPEEGIAELEEAVGLEDVPMVNAFLAYAYGMAGRIGEASSLLVEVEEVSREIYTCAYEIAVTHVALGNHDAAFEWLDQAYEDRADCIPFLNVDPRLDPVREDPRFVALTERVGF